jgi:hypothetical protein
MEWLLDPTAPVRDLRHEITGYLRRHAEIDASLDDAELVIAELLTNAVRHTTGPSWVGIDWRDERPTLWVADIGPGFDLAAELPELGAEAAVLVGELPRIPSPARGACGRAQLRRLGLEARQARGETLRFLSRLVAQPPLVLELLADLSVALDPGAERRPLRSLLGELARRLVVLLLIRGDLRFRAL